MGFLENVSVSGKDLNTIPIVFSYNIMEINFVSGHELDKISLVEEQVQ